MSNPKEIESLKQVFRALDTTGDGIVSKSELDRVLVESGFSRQEADNLFKFVDVNSDGKVSIEEFLKGFQMSS